MPLSIEAMLEQNTEQLCPLPEAISKEIGDASVSIYPWEISYCASNNLNYIPLATIQAYSTYTPYLDKISAAKFLNSDPPEYILLTLNTIDNRWPFIECPQTWEAIKNNYYIKIQEDDLFLLKRRDESVTVNYELINTDDYTLDDAIELNGADYIKISARLSIKGSLAKTLWKIPEINMHVYYSDGSEATHRVLLDMFTEGVSIATLPTTKETLTDVLNDTGHLSSVSKIVFEGDGLRCYKHAIKVEFYKTSSNKNIHPNENIKTNYTNEIEDINFSLYEIRQDSVNCNIEAQIGNQYYKRLIGWAYIKDIGQFTDQCQICIEIDGKYYPCTIIPRGDVKDAFDLPTDLVGFTILYNNGMVGKVCIIDKENHIVYKQ
ncbi:hypothetical protein C804_06020 [Lachnospiraceae bacterium A4]|nr:hypothetical protein C804_06020 [Lachnospiraceae bacterium A4]